MANVNTPAQIPEETPTADRLALTLFLATALHAVVILGIGFNPMDRSKPDPTLPTLDITIVNPSRSLPPETYDYLAEASQDGGGNTEQRVRPQQQLIKQAPPPAPAKPAPEQERPPVITRDRSPRAVPQRPQPRPETQRERPSAAQLVNRSLEMLSLNEQINQSLLAYSRAPKQKFISARTREFKYANYMRDWVTKVERVGDLNYPDAARRQRLSGSLIVDVSLNSDGTVRNITIVRPSGHKILDDAAIRIVRLAAPFPPFPENIRKETDILHITRTWEFTSGNRLQGR